MCTRVRGMDPGGTSRCKMGMRDTCQGVHTGTPAGVRGKAGVFYTRAQISPAWQQLFDRNAI